MTLTASGFARAVGCPGSFALPQANTTNQYSERGNGGHAVICAFVSQVREGMSIESALINVPEEWQAACEELAPYAPHLVPEAAHAIRVVGETAGLFMGSDTGRAYDHEPGWVYGTADLAGQIGDEVVVIDVKTGWMEVDHPEKNLQLRLLACMAATYYRVDKARVLILRCPEGQEPRWIDGRLDALDLDETEALARRTYGKIQDRQIDSLVSAPSVTEGPWCRYCPAIPYCPAKTALIRRLANGSEGDELGTMVPLDRRTAGVAWERLRSAKAILNRVEAACHAFLAEHGEIELPSGKILRRVEEEGNEKLDGDEVFNVALQLCGPDVANAATERKATKKALEAAARAAYGRGGAAKVRMVLEEVRKRGGSYRTMTTKLVEVEAGE